MGANFIPNQVLVVPGVTIAQRSAKYIYAKTQGIPIVTQEWVHACASLHRLMPLEAHKQSKQVVRGPCKPHDVFRGCKVFVAGPDKPDGRLAELVQHAGEPAL